MRIQYGDRIVDVSVMTQRQVRMLQATQKTVDEQYIDRVVDVSVIKTKRLTRACLPSGILKFILREPQIFCLSNSDAQQSSTCDSSFSPVILSTAICEGTVLRTLRLHPPSYRWCSPTTHLYHF